MASIHFCRIVIRHFFSRAAVAAVLFASAPLALAHPALLSSSLESRDNPGSPLEELRLTFNEPIEIAFTRIRLIDSTGKAMSGDATQADKSDPKAAVLPLPTLAPGTYIVHWAAVGRDGHRVKGEFSFSVK